MNKSISAEKAALCILVALLVVNGIWAAISSLGGPLLGFTFYGVILFLFWRKSHFQAGIIGGAFGLVIHIYELIIPGIGELEGVGAGLFFINLILPVALIYFSYKALITKKKR